MIRLYTTPSCPYCLTLKEYLKEKKIEFEEVDMSQDKALQDELIEKTGQMVTPILEVDGQYVVGFDKAKINKILNIED